MNLGNTIKKARKDRGQTQGELASLSGISQNYLSMIEKNMREPNLATLKIISDTLSIPLPILFFLSLNEDDIEPHKREAYEVIGPSVKLFINEFFSVQESPFKKGR